MYERRYGDGEAIFRHGEASTAVYRVRSGLVRVVKPEIDGRPVKFQLHADEIFGFTGLLSGRRRLGRAIAIGDTVIDVVRRWELLRILEAGNDGIRSAFAAFFDIAQGAAAESMTTNPSAAKPEPAGEIPRLRLIPTGRDLASALGQAGFAVDRLPFVVGRLPDAADHPAYFDVDLKLPDTRPYQLSRRHFAIELSDGTLIVRDCGSYHGTTVNGEPIGPRTAGSTTVLDDGENEIIAGAPGTPFRFTVVVGIG